MVTAADTTETRTNLVRALGLSHAASVVIGVVIGSGIFLVPSEMMQAVGSASLVYLAWVVGGLLSFFGALTYAELGSVRPFAGGEYVYVRDAYGPLPGFLYGWTWFLIAKPASIATDRELQSVDPDALSDEELAAYLRRCHAHHAAMISKNANPSRAFQWLRTIVRVCWEKASGSSTAAPTATRANTSTGTDTPSTAILIIRCWLDSSAG